MHGAPLALAPWGDVLCLCLFFHLIIKGRCHFLMYAWDQISLIRTYTALQSRSGCNRSLFMHALRSRHPSASAAGCRLTPVSAMCGKEMVQRHFPTPKRGGSLDCASDIRKMQSARTTCGPWGCGCNRTFVGDMWDMGAVVTTPFPDDRKCSTTTHTSESSITTHTPMAWNTSY